MASTVRARSLLVVTRNMPPTVGGIERLMHRLSDGLCGKYSCVYVAPRGSRAYLAQAQQVYELPHTPAIIFVLLACVLVSYLLWRRQFHAVVAANGLMAFIAAVPARIRRVPLITLVHGLDIVASHLAYRALALPLIRTSAAVIANSRNTARLALDRGVPRDRVKVIIPGVDVPARQSVLPMQETPKAPVLLSVGRLVRRKGVADFIRQSLPLIVRRFPSVRFLVIGSTPEKALRREWSELKRVCAAVAETGLGDQVQLLGRVSDEELARQMDGANVHVFPVKDLVDDVEGFGLVALEAAACGVPTVAFDAGGVSDAVDPGVNGTLVPPGDYHAFAEAVCELLSRDRSNLAPSCIEYARRHGWQGYADEVMQVIDSALAVHS